ncbi:cell division cycle-associated protein 2 isoform X1 [Sigmodon hispidus]
MFSEAESALRSSSSEGSHGPRAGEMDTSSQIKQLTESKECVVNNSENDSFILGTQKLLTPKKHVEDRTPNLCTPSTHKSPLDFSTVTVEQLGITPESFVKTPSGKSSSQKIRRRSTVGVRGSPETNCLISFIARQRSLKSATRSPFSRNSPLQGSPGLYPHASALRVRMAAFRSAFHSIQETENMAGGPEASKADRESKTSALIKTESLVEYQQSGFPVNSSSKRRRISSQSSPDDHLSSAKGRVVCEQVLTDPACAVDTSSADLAKKSSDIGSAQPGCVVASLPELMEASHGLRVADGVEGTESVAIPLDTAAAQVSSNTASTIRSPVTPGCKSSSPPSKTFVLRSVLKKPGKLFAENIKECNQCDDGTHLIADPSNYYKEQKAGRENCNAPAFLNLKKRKKVTFGEDLSPEVFDESLPPNTPLCKGETPVSQRNIKAASPLQSPAHEPLPQPNFDDENLENIEPPLVSFASLSPSKPSLSETLPGNNTYSSLNNHEETNCTFGRPTRASHRRKQLVSLAEEGVCNSHATEAEPCKEKNTNRRRSQERKCTSKALPGKKQVLKWNRRKKRKGKKSVEKCLYGERDIASKKPLLSPIPELPEGSEMTPLTDGAQATRSDDFSLSGELEDAVSLEIPVKRKRLLPQGKDLSGLDSASEQAPASELCCCLLSTPAVSERRPNGMARDIGRGSNSRAERKRLSAKEPTTETKKESSPVPCASVSPGHTVSENPKSVCSPLCQELSKADQNTENPCDFFMVSENVNIKCERESEFRAPKGNLQCDPFTSDSEGDRNCSKDILVQNLKEFTSHSENVGRKCTEKSSLTSGRERKRRRQSMHCCEGQTILEQNESPASSCSGGSSAEISLGNPQLCEDLSEALEQSLQRANGKAKVRRSTRLQGDLENKGLVWMLLPPPSTSQKTKRRTTICAFDSREFESMSSREETISSGQNPSALSSSPGSGSQPVGSSKLLGKRRKSLCVSTLTNTESATESPCLKRRPSMKKRESS